MMVNAEEVINPLDKRVREGATVLPTVMKTVLEAVKEPIPTVIHEDVGEVSDKDDDETPLPEINTVDPTAKTYTDDEVLPILDDLLANGYALANFSFRKTKVALRTRFTWEEQYIYKHLEQSQLKTALNYQREFLFITMAASLVQFGNHFFEPMNQGEEKALYASMKERYEFICSLNSVLTDILQDKLNDFDAKQRFIITNFDRLLKAF